MKTTVEKHFDKVAREYDQGKQRYSYYYENLKKLLHSFIPYNKNILEIGCGTGDLLASLKPKNGYGFDISSEMVKIARIRHPDRNLIFSDEWPKAKFDYIFMSDVIEHLENPEKVFKNILGLMNKNAVFVNTMANPIWEPLLMFWERRGWKMKEGKHKRIKYQEIKKTSEEEGFLVTGHGYKLLIPLYIPVISNFMNKHLEKYFSKFSFIEYIIAEAK